jgi:hypothetical protein
MKGIIIRNEEGNEVKIEFREGYLCFEDNNEVSEVKKTVEKPKTISLKGLDKWKNNKFFKHISKRARNNPKKVFKHKTARKTYYKTGEEIMAKQIEALEEKRNSIYTISDNGMFRYVRNRETGGNVKRKYNFKKKPAKEPEVEVVDDYEANGLVKLNQNLNE